MSDALLLTAIAAGTALATGLGALPVIALGSERARAAQGVLRRAARSLAADLGRRSDQRAAGAGGARGVAWKHAAHLGVVAGTALGAALMLGVGAALEV